LKTYLLRFIDLETEFLNEPYSCGSGDVLLPLMPEQTRLLVDGRQRREAGVGYDGSYRVDRIDFAVQDDDNG
jgi:hypothetical protein